MTELPTATEPSTTHNPKVARALADIEAAKRDATPDVAWCLDAIADLVSKHDDPDAVFDRVLDGFAREELRILAITHGVRFARLTLEAAESETNVFWQFDGQALAVVPRGQRPADTLAQLRSAIADREEEQRLADDFQASVAAGHVEDVEAWYTRTSKAAS